MMHYSILLFGLVATMTMSNFVGATDQTPAGIFSHNSASTDYSLGNVIRRPLYKRALALSRKKVTRAVLPAMQDFSGGISGSMPGSMPIGMPGGFGFGGHSRSISSRGGSFREEENENENEANENEGNEIDKEANENETNENDREANENEANENDREEGNDRESREEENDYDDEERYYSKMKDRITRRALPLIY